MSQSANDLEKLMSRIDALRHNQQALDVALADGARGALEQAESAVVYARLKLFSDAKSIAKRVPAVAAAAPVSEPEE